MKNLHKPVMLEEIISFLPSNKSLNVIDATFGGGGYSKTILEKLNVNGYKTSKIDEENILAIKI